MTDATTTPTANVTEASKAPSTDRRARRRSDRAGGQDGFALVWFALVLSVLIAMAGAAIDVWSWWYQGNQNQRAADAAALAGVVFMPEDPISARNTARDIALANGVLASELTIETNADDSSLQENELRVTVDNDVPTRFLKLLGVTTANIERDATAQYTSRLPMGSPESYLGRDPERGLDPGYWLSVSGRGESKIGGDRYQNDNCGATYVYNCNAGTSTEYSQQGYAFAVELTSAPTGPLVIEAWDPVHTETSSQDCTNAGRLPTGGANGYTAQLPLIQARYPTDPLVAARYLPGDTIYCQGDVGGGNQNGSDFNVTTFIVREPDLTQANDFDNTAIDTNPATPDSGCTRQFRGINLRPNGTTRTIYELLAGAEGGPIADATYATYRRWVGICTIPQATVSNWYANGLRSVIIQVRSNAALNAPFTADTSGRDGRNHFSLRAGYGSGTGGGVQMFAQGRLPIHNGADGASTTEFFLTRIPPGNAGRTLSLEFFDVADASQPAVFEIVPPVGFGGSFSDCTFIRYSGNNNGTNTGQNMSADASGCTLNNVNNSRYNGRVTDVRVKVPTGYTCNLAIITDCWIKVRVTYAVGGTVYDHTVWNAGVVGEPVRLVE